MNISIILVSLFLYSHTAKYKVYFSSSFNLLVYLCHYFQIKRIVWEEFDRAFYYFPRQSYTRNGTLDGKLFFFCCYCYILVVLTGHWIENPNVFYFLKVLHVSSFTIIKEENDCSLHGESIPSRHTAPWDVL